MNLKKCAFIVNRDPVSAHSLKDHLQKIGFEVQCFSSGNGAIHELNNRPDLIVLDHDLGEEKDAFQYLRKFRNKAPNIPVLYLSDKNDTKTASQALGFGAAYYIEKNDALLERLPKALEFINTRQKSRFGKALQSFRKAVFSLYNF